MKNNSKIQAHSTAFVKTFSKELAKQLFSHMDAHKLQDPEKVFEIYVTNLNGIASKMNNAKSSMNDMMLKDTNRLDIVKLQPV